MSKTLKNKKFNFKNEKKLKPYVGSKGQRYKFKPEQADLPGTAKRISKAAKLEAKNANRSLKKAARQQIKKEIRTLSIEFITLFNEITTTSNQNNYQYESN